ncbi:MAG TPA: TerC family protein [Candidatus Thermoplasmatota archaeon]|nr:TerC family protein [Candidatus Thermoplasmatota archaeon]
MELLSDPNAWIAFASLAALEVVLGIDNVVFLAILSEKLPEEKRARARQVGLGLAMLFRIALLFSIAWIIGLTQPLFEVAGFEVSGRDLVLIFGGLFLLGKATHEIHGSLEGEVGHVSKRVPASLGAVLVQIILLDMVFSLDSVITAVGMTDLLAVMVAAVVVAVAVMMFAAGPIAAFVRRHPTVKMLALSFLILIGALLVAEGFGQHIPKGYVYFAMAFALGVEMLNLRLRRAGRPVDLHTPYVPEDGKAPKGAKAGRASRPPESP